jgi:hypothetical protein
LDIAEQPENRALRNFRKPAVPLITIQETYLKSLGNTSLVTPVAQQQIHYYCWQLCLKPSQPLIEKFQYIYGDYLRLNLDLGAIRWMEMVTPVLIG